MLWAWKGELEAPVLCGLSPFGSGMLRGSDASGHPEGSPSCLPHTGLTCWNTNLLLFHEPGWGLSFLFLLVEISPGPGGWAHSAALGAVTLTPGSASARAFPCVCWSCGISTESRGDGSVSERWKEARHPSLGTEHSALHSLVHSSQAGTELLPPALP